VTNDAYTARVLEKVETRPGCWRGLRVGVFRGEEQVGEYQRGYDELYRTFFPFVRGGVWYALYSAAYTKTSVMRLPECEPVGGETDGPGGFCPVDYYVPSWRWVRDGKLSGCGHVTYVEHDHEHADLHDEAAVRAVSEIGAEADVGPVEFAPFGFVAGCVWGDDSSWKVQVLDLRDASNPVRTDALGYFVLPDGMALRDAVRFDAGTRTFAIAEARRYSYATDVALLPRSEERPTPAPWSTG
jgi:hypothetical protein